MNDNNDIRWQQRFSNYRKALASLKEFIEWGELNKLEEQGLIKAFEYTYELAWNTLKDFLEDQGYQNIAGSRDAFRKAFALGIIENGEGWMTMLKSRNQTTHTYNEVTARDIANDIKNSYYQMFSALEESLLNRVNKQ
jgi:nucleotidyltransferase substrate binding protein (TIGR01987 family)